MKDLVQRFLSGEVTINCANEEEQHGFLEFVNALKYRWRSGEPALEDDGYKEYEPEEMAFRCSFNGIRQILSYAPVRFYEEGDTKVVTFTTFKQFILEHRNQIVSMLLNNTAINCETEEQADSFLTTLDELGYTWITRDKLTERNYHEKNDSETCYATFAEKLVGYADVEFLKENLNICILNYTQFAERLHHACNIAQKIINT